MSCGFYTIGNEALNHCFQNCKKKFSKSVELLSRNRDCNMTLNEHVYAICCRPDVAGDVISGENVKSIEGYVVLKFEVDSRVFSDGGGGGGHRRQH